MTDEELREFEEQNWARVPAADRERCVNDLRTQIGAGGATREEWLAAMDDPGFHMFAGRDIRNALREVMGDDDLPEVPYPGGSSYRNWDDFYMAALREALA
jgi:hypothetical protein